MPASDASNGEHIERGRIFLAPPDHHLVVEGNRLRTSKAPRENLARPAVDPLFRSAAFAHGGRVIGVILSGHLTDGTAGLMEVKRRGGLTVVQDPDDAESPGMPESALLHVEVDHSVRAAEMAALLDRLSREPAGPPDRFLTMSVRMDHAMSTPTSDATPDPAGMLSWPECGGPIQTSKHGTLTRFRCIIGHAYTGETMLSAHAHAVERALCEAMRVHQERIRLYRKLADEARNGGQIRMAARYEESMREYERHADVLRQLIETTAD